MDAESTPIDTVAKKTNFIFFEFERQAAVLLQEVFDRPKSGMSDFLLLIPAHLTLEIASLSGISFGRETVLFEASNLKY